MKPQYKPRYVKPNFDEIFAYDELEVTDKEKKEIEKQKAIAKFLEKKFPNSYYVGERRVHTFWGVPIFTWDRWEDNQLGYLTFYNCEFCFYSMKKYNGSTVVTDVYGKLKIIPLLNNHPIWEGYYIELGSFRKYIQKQLKERVYPVYVPGEEDEDFDPEYFVDDEEVEQDIEDELNRIPPEERIVKYGKTAEQMEQDAEMLRKNLAKLKAKKEQEKEKEKENKAKNKK